MKKVVITGATGFIGVHIVKRFLMDGVWVYAVVRPKSPNKKRLPENSNMHYIELEMDDIGQLAEKVPVSIDCFIHLAWEGTRAPYRDDKALQKRNVLHAIKAMEAAKQLNVSCFIGCGSQAEYGICSGRVDETYQCKPVTEYGKAKYRACNELKKMAEAWGIRFIWTRIFSVYGRYDYPGTLIMSCLDKMLKNEPVRVTECIQLWDYVYVGDVADAFVKLLESVSAEGIYNVASGSTRLLKEYIEQMKRITGSQSIIEYGALPYGKEGPISLNPVVSKLEKAGWSAVTSFEKGIQQLLLQ